ncbi:hypothetical protein BHE74_00028704 [Ensete ventricosum]|nr:hypothetical protein BHE74_00028704 [Ensete ventricosum]RZS23822.1 hypothetical protein BHM03_00056809 [Ensete ventricosum]
MLRPGMIGTTKELDYSSAYIRLRKPDKSKDKTECEAIDNSVMGLVVSLYCRGGTSVELSISCSHRRRALVVKGAKELENAQANSNYQDKAEG